MHISAIVPVYNELDSLSQLHEELTSALSQSGPYEIIYIDDGCDDGSSAKLKEIADHDSSVKMISFFRNYGKAAALAAGFEAARGDVVVTLDSDLQDDPAEIPEMISMLEEGWDLVSGWKKVRHDPLSKRIPSKIYNAVVRLFTGVPVHDSNCGLKVYRAEVAKSVEVYGGLHRYIPALAKYKGFRVTEKVVQHRPRQFGKTKYGLARYFHGLLDLFTVLFLGRYFQRPLHFFGFVGLLILFGGIVVSIYLTVNWFLGVPIGNRPLFFLGILLIIVGIQFFSLGLLAELFVQQRHRDQRLVKEVYPAEQEAPQP
ncbi:MAG: glycosyltransferase family 2 protein [Fidelibacterota bacterium]|nr:MAG: glycosyltransferase family 2 protein [Candidatus Neomarinimicrobiota bacterium]